MRALAKAIGVKRFKEDSFNYSNHRDADQLWNLLNRLVFNKKLAEIGIDMLSRDEAIKATIDFYKIPADSLKPPKMFYGCYLPD